MDSNNLTPLRKGVVGVQFLFVAFGATVLVPLLVGLDPSTALFTAGIGTLIFHAVTRGKVPIFLGSSFAFIAPIIKATELYGLAGTLSGMLGVALVYFAMSALVKWQGVRVVERLFPPVVIGPVIILIGLSLAGTGVEMAKENWVLALLSLVTAVVVSMKAKGLLKLIPIFCGIIVGYLAAWLFYDLDLSGVRDAAWIGLPQFVFPKFSWADLVYDSGSHCSGDRTYWRCICGKYGYGKGFCERPRSASYFIGGWAGLPFCRIGGWSSGDDLFGSNGSHVINENYESASYPDCSHIRYLVLRHRQNQCVAEINSECSIGRNNAFAFRNNRLCRNW